MKPLDTPADSPVLSSGLELPDLSSRTVFVLDWDGTVFDSMAIKLRSFSQVVSGYLAGTGIQVAPEQAARIYQSHSGKPRREIFSIVGCTFGKHLDDTELDNMSEQLTALNFRVLAEARLFDDGVELLARLAQLGRTPYLSSSVPQKELEFFTSRKLPADLRVRMGGIFGSSPGFGKGRQHVARIMAKEGVPSSRLIAIGDDEADFDLSTAAGIDCIIVNRTQRELPAGIPVVENLAQLTGRLQ